MLINSPNISGSLTVTGNSVISGSLTVLGSITGAITGSATSASYVEYTNVANKPTLVSGSSQVTYSGLTGIPSGIVSGSSQVTYSGLTGIPSGIVSGSSQVTYSGLTGTPSGIVSGSAQIASFGIFATTGSNGFNGSQSITGSLTVTGQVVAQTLNVQQVTSSIVYSSGSNIFGNTLANTQQFTGSVSVTGSLTVAGTTIANGDIYYYNAGNLNAIITSGAAANGRIYLYASATADIGLQAGGNSWFLNNLGIGVNNPGSRLEVKGANTDQIRIAHADNSTTKLHIGQFGDGSYIFNNYMYVGSHTTDDASKGSTGIVLDTADILFQNAPASATPTRATRMVILANGQVGIGTASPDRNLEVETGSDTYLRVTGNRGNADGVHVGNLEFYNSNTSRLVGEVRGITGTGGTQSNSGQLAFYTNDNGTYAERMRITSDGAVLIGGTSADYGKLDVTVTPSSYTAALGLGLQTNSGEGNSVGISFKTKISLSGAIWENARIAAFTDAVSSSVYGALAFYTMSATTLSERMRIGNNGFVGIGTVSPAYKLDVYSSTSPATIGLKSDATYNSIIRDYNTSSTSTYLDITTERTDGGGFNFLLLVSSTLTASGANRNYYTFAVQGRGTTATATQLSNVTAGTSARTAIAVSFPSNGVIRLTLTGGEDCQIKVTAIGHGSL